MPCRNLLLFLLSYKESQSLPDSTVLLWSLQVSHFFSDCSSAVRNFAFLHSVAKHGCQKLVWLWLLCNSDFGKKQVFQTNLLVQGCDWLIGVSDRNLWASGQPHLVHADACRLHVHVQTQKHAHTSCSLSVSDTYKRIEQFHSRSCIKLPEPCNQLN